MRIQIRQWCRFFFERIHRYRYAIVCIAVCLSLSLLLVCLPLNPLMETRAEDKDRAKMPLVAMQYSHQKLETDPNNGISEDGVIKTNPENQTVTFLEAMKLSPVMASSRCF